MTKGIFRFPDDWETRDATEADIKAANHSADRVHVLNGDGVQVYTHPDGAVSMLAHVFLCYPSADRGTEEQLEMELEPGLEEDEPIGEAPEATEED